MYKYGESKEHDEIYDVMDESIDAGDSGHPNDLMKTFKAGELVGLYASLTQSNSWYTIWVHHETDIAEPPF